MRKVLKNYSEVAHFWANETQHEGRYAHMFFEGAKIYSYGYHFEIARITEDKNKKKVVLFTTREYSPTTSRHKWNVRSACSHLKTFTVPSFEDHTKNLEYYLKEIEETQASATRARSRAEYLKGHLAGTIKTAYDYAMSFKGVSFEDKNKIRKWNNKLLKGLLFSKVELEKIKKAYLNYRESVRLQAEKRARELEETRLEGLEQLEQWKKGEEINLRDYWRVEIPIGLRVKDNRIQTSKGAEITIRSALRLWECLKTKGTQNPVGLTLDNNYTVNSITPEIVSIGCHQIPVKEIERIAETLGVK